MPGISGPPCRGDERHDQIIAEYDVTLLRVATGEIFTRHDAAERAIERFLTSNPATALLSLHLNLGEALDWHHRLHGMWRVSSKWLLTDLRRWDPTLAALVVYAHFARAKRTGAPYGAPVALICCGGTAL